MDNAKQIGELIEFLHDRNPQVRQLAVNGFLPFTVANHPARSLLLTPTQSQTQDKKNDDDDLLKPGSLKPTIIEDLKRLCEDQHRTAHDAFSALINLSDTQPVAEQLDDPDFLSVIYFTIIDNSSLLADLACMLLSNLTKFESIIKTCLTASIPPHSWYPSILQQQEEEEDSTSLIEDKFKKSMTPLMNLLVEIFSRGDEKKLNSNANFDFLASVWANLSATVDGRNYLVGVAPFTAIPSEAPLSQLTPFTEHPSLIRRGGVISAIKNCCFVTEVHDELLSTRGFNLLPYILLPLMGPESIGENPEEEEDFPIECQFLGPLKKREIDLNLRLILIESLILLATFKNQRSFLKIKKVYRIIQILHLNEPSELVQESIERLVNLLMRDEECEPTHQPNNVLEEEEEQLIEV